MGVGLVAGFGVVPSVRVKVAGGAVVVGAGGAVVGEGAVLGWATGWLAVWRAQPWHRPEVGSWSVRRHERAWTPWRQELQFSVTPARLLHPQGHLGAQRGHKPDVGEVRIEKHEGKATRPLHREQACSMLPHSWQPQTQGVNLVLWIHFRQTWLPEYCSPQLG